MQPAGGFGFNQAPQPSGFGGAAAPFGAAPSPFGAAPSPFGAPPTQTTQPTVGFAAFGQAQPAAQPTSNFAAFGQAQPAPFGGAAPQQAQPSGFGFAQPPAQQQQAASAPAFGTGFGQPTQPAPAPAGFGGFGGAAASPAQPSGFAAFSQPSQAPSPASFSFGQQQQQSQPAPFGMPSQPSPGFSGFGQQASGFGAGVAAQPAGPAFGQPAAPAAVPAFGFGQQPEQHAASAFGSAAPKFDFGASARKQQAAPAGAAVAGAAPQLRKAGGLPAGAPQLRAAAVGAQGKGEEGGDLDYEAEKRRALAAMPKFAGGGGGGGGPPAARAAVPPPAAARARSPSPARDLDAEEQARRTQRAARFNAAAAAAAAALGPPLGPAAPTAAPVLAAARPGSAGGGRAFGGGMRRVPSNLGLSQQAQQVQGGDESEMEGDIDEEGDGLHGAAIAGTCEDMCPAQERSRRQGMNDIQLFERDPADLSTTNASLAVKRFARTVDNPSPSEFRTRGALQRTMAHLRGILDRTDVRLGLVHKFLWDRYRSVRQDLSIQGIQDEFAVSIFEEIVRFHILSEHELCEEDQSVTNMEGFNSHLNMEQMNNALISLNYMYTKLANAGTPANTEAEFRAFQLLSQMSQRGKYKAEKKTFLATLQGLRAEVKSSKAVQWVLSLQDAFASNNAVRFFGLVRQAPYLLACLAHTYFPQMRMRALRMLSEALSPASTRPTPLELSWLQEALMMDSLEEAGELCTTYGFEVSSENGTPVVLLVKGAFAEPEGAVVRRRSRQISAMAPGSRSAAVTTPALAPLSAEEAAAAEAQRQESARIQQEAAELARHLAAAEQQRRQQVQQAAAEVAQQAQREQEEKRRREQAEALELLQRQVAAQRAQQAEAQRQAALAEVQRAQQETARLVATAAEARRQEEARQRWLAEQHRLAAEAEQARLEAAAREAQAREAERRRLEEEERRRVAEERRRLEEKRQRRLAKQRHALAKLAFHRWRQAAARAAEERRRQEKARQALKACRVGFAAASSSARLPLQAAKPLSPEQRQRAQASQQASPGTRTSALPRTQHAQQAQQASQQQGAGTLDLPSLVAPLLVQRSPAAEALYWKVVVLGAGAGAHPAVPQQQQQQLSVLSRWLALQLSHGGLAPAPCGSAYVEGPLPLHVSNSATSVRLSTCVALPHSLHQEPAPGGERGGALAGASAAILPVGLGSSPAQLAQVLQAVPGAVRLPVLLLAPDPHTAQHWQEVAAGLDPPEAAAMVHVVSLLPPQQALAPAPSYAAVVNGSAGGAAAPVFSLQQLIQGLRWLAARAPQQPLLEVGSLEAAAREGLGVVLGALHKVPAAAAEDYVDAYNAVLSLLAEAVRDAHQSAASTWQWPPPELCPAALSHWHSTAAAAQQLQLLAAACIPGDQQQLPAGAGGAQQIAMALYHHLGALGAGAGAPSLILPAEVHAQLRRRLKEAAAAAAAAAVARRQLQPAPAAAVRRIAAAVPPSAAAANGTDGSNGAAPAGPWGRPAAAAPAPSDVAGAARQKRKWEPEGQPAPAPTLRQQDGRQQLQGALARLQQQLSQEQQMHAELSSQARGLSGGSGRENGGTRGVQQAWADPWDVSSPPPLGMGELAARLRTEKEAAASLQAHLEAAAALL